MRVGLCLLMCCTAFSACGSEPGPAQITTALLIPQTLAEDLATIEIYLFETKLGQPRAESLLDNQNHYKSHDWQKMEKYPYTGTGEVVMNGIPDRGNVWRFYARGLNGNGVLIGHGATFGTYDIDPDSDAPLQVDITIIPID